MNNPIFKKLLKEEKKKNFNILRPNFMTMERGKMKTIQTSVPTEKKTTPKDTKEDPKMQHKKNEQEKEENIKETKPKKIQPRIQQKRETSTSDPPNNEKKINMFYKFNQFKIDPETKKFCEKTDFPSNLTHKNLLHTRISDPHDEYIFRGKCIKEVEANDNLKMLLLKKDDFVQVIFEENSFYSTLRNKLLWGEDRRNL